VAVASGKRVERETGFEPATPSLEGSRSSQLSYSRLVAANDDAAPKTSLAGPHRTPLDLQNDPSAVGTHACLGPPWWGEEDSNLRRHEPTDLQSAPFGRLGISPEFRGVPPDAFAARTKLGAVELAEGIEPPTR
jgi:hypothetical protein